MILKKSHISNKFEVLKIAKDHNTRIHHVKPHGALYNLAFYDIKTCEIIIKCIKNTL